MGSGTPDPTSGPGDDVLEYAGARGAEGIDAGGALGLAAGATHATGA